MSAPQTIGISYRHATAVSIALHLLAIVAVCWMWAATLHSPSASDPITREAVRISHITISFHAPRSRPRPFVAPLVRHTLAFIAVASNGIPANRRPVAVRPVRYARTPAVAARVARGTHATLVRAASVAAATALAAVTPPTASEAAAAGSLAETPAASTPAPPARVEPEAPSVVAAAVAVTAPSADRESDAPVGGWGQSFSKPIVADDDALASVRASVVAAEPIRAAVVVDESGRATRVTLPASLSGDVRADLERRLLALRYIPAECNGLRCTATLTIAL